MNGNLSVTFLGTCACNYSRYQHRFSEDLRDRFDRDTRRASALWVEGGLMIDCGPHAMGALAVAGIPASAVTDLLLTPLHRDHFCPEAVQELALAKGVPLRLWVSEEAILPPLENVTVIPMEKFRPYITESGWTVTGVSANHDPDAFPQHLLLERDGKRMLYATDGAWFMTKTYYHLKDSHLDLLILDATCGEGEGEYRIAEHNTLPMIRLMLPSLQTMGIIDEHTEIYLTHLAPSLHRSNEETEMLAEAMGCQVAYDGTELSI